VDQCIAEQRADRESNEEVQDASQKRLASDEDEGPDE
jgi:hypothetical protein